MCHSLLKRYAYVVTFSLSLPLVSVFSGWRYSVCIVLGSDKETRSICLLLICLTCLNLSLYTYIYISNVIFLK